MAARGVIFLRAVLIATILALPVFAPGLSLVKRINETLIAKRSALAPRSSSGTIVFIAIDKKSLDAVGLWPWPRSIYAKLLRHLQAANVGDIFIDIDFSARASDGKDDRVFAAALAEVGGVLLPVFEQPSSVASGEAAISQPAPEFLKNAWPVFANVIVDDDGVVRSVARSGELGGATISSAPVALARSDNTGGRFTIDYSIDPGSVPTFSLSDVLSGRIGAAELEGRSIVVGASAVELKDFFLVPVRGVLPGPLVHVLAAETIMQERMLTKHDQAPVELLLATLLIVTLLRFRPIGLALTTSFSIFLIVVVEFAAFELQRRYALSLATVVPNLIVLLAWILSLNERIDIGQILLSLARRDAQDTHRLVNQIIADSTDGILVFDRKLNILNSSPSAASILGPATGNSLLNVRDIAFLSKLSELTSRHADEPTKVHSGEITLVHDIGAQVVHHEASITISATDKAASAIKGGVFGCVVLRDVTARVRYQSKLQKLAEQDELTGLLNRREFMSRIKYNAGLVAVLDVENFVSTCVALGRGVGDEFLKAISVRLSENYEGCPIGRVDGNVFSIQCHADNGDVFANQILSLFDAEIGFGGLCIPASVRVGIANSGLIDPGEALQAAESALVSARERRSRWASHDPADAIRQARSRQLEADLRAGLQLGQFYVLYQPQIELSSRKLVGAEALLRWMHPAYGSVSPAEFIPIAESCGFICELGRWTLVQACIEAARWPDLTVSVNVSPIQFERADIYTEVQDALSMSGLPAKRLCLELTESAFLDKGDDVISKMALLRRDGVMLSLDDFGTGYSSMSSLADLPMDKIKIDQSFIRKMVAQPSVGEIVKAILAMAKGLKLEIVAEGIEGDAEYHILKQLGCDIGQGYLFGKPQPATDILKSGIAGAQIS